MPDSYPLGPSPRATGDAPAKVPLAAGPVWAAAAAQALILLATSANYGYDRDELYFRLLPAAWGYVDQPPLTPLLAKAMTAIDDSVAALRIPAIVASAASVLLCALIAREVGGGRFAQGLAAWGYAFASYPLVLGHVFLTASIDATAWLAVLLFVIRALLYGRTEAWIWAGAVAGASLYNKLLVVVLIASLALGIVLAGPRRLLASRAVVAAAVVAVVVGIPTIVYQAANGWPQLSFGHQLALHNEATVRVSMWYLLPLLLGPPLVIVWVAGLVAIWRRPEWRPLRCVAAAFPILLVFVFLMGSQPYYEFGLLAALFGVGCVPVSEWLSSGRVRRRRVVAVALGLINAAVSAVIALPLLPVTVVGATPIPGLNTTAADTVGWPAFTGEVQRVFDDLPSRTRRRTVLVTTNYGEAGALVRYWHGSDRPGVYSGHNQLYFDGRPPSAATSVVFVGGQFLIARSFFRTCRVAGHLNDRVGVDNEEQGEPIAVCGRPVPSWSAVWPRLKHED